VTDFDIGRILSPHSLSFNELQSALGLQRRSTIILLTALNSMGLLQVESDNRINLSPLGREKMSPDSPHHLRGYVGLGGFSHDAQQLAQCLRTNKPAGDVSFVYFNNAGPSALDDPQTADVLTRAMADRARSIAPFVQDVVSTNDHHHLLDVGGGHGLYSIALLQQDPTLTATIIDRAPALAVAKEYRDAHGLSDRLTLVQGDIHTAIVPDTVDTILLANILHDYDADSVQALITLYANSLPPGGTLRVMEAFLNPIPDSPGYPPISDGPKEVAAYSILLASLCEGCCYRADEIATWLKDAGLKVSPLIELPTHMGIITGTKK
jgi:hypothetical protein